MLNLMQNYGIFTKVTILQEPIANEAKEQEKVLPFILGFWLQLALHKFFKLYTLEAFFNAQ